MKSTQRIIEGLVLGALFAGANVGMQAAYLPDYHLQVGIGPNVVVGNNGVKIDGTMEGNFYMGDITLTGFEWAASGRNGRAVGPFHSVCTDVSGTVNLNQWYYYQDVSFGGLTGLDPLWGNDGANQPSPTAGARAIQVAADIFSRHLPSAATLNYNSHIYNANEQWAALQLAVWEALYDTRVNPASTTYGFGGAGGGRFVNNGGVSSAIQNLALYWVNGSGSTALNTYAGDLLLPLQKDSKGAWVVATTTQEMLFRITPVPEPTTLIAGLLLLLPFGASSLRVLRRSRSA
jgi:hypothetical protein